MNYKQPWYATRKAINTYIIAGVFVVLLMLVVAPFSTANNHYVALNNNYQNSQSNVSKEQERSLVLFNNLVGAIENYNQFEGSTQTTIAKARSQAQSGNASGAALTIQAVAEAYPNLKSQANYQQAMTEFSVTANRIAQYREQQNNDARSFNNYVESFPATLFLSADGKDKTPKPYLQFTVTDSQTMNLFSQQQ